VTTHSYSTDSVISQDGTTIGYRQLGHGPGIILVHGAMQSSHNFMQLAAALSDSCTVYLPDRRGRGLSEPPSDNHSRYQKSVSNHSIQKECEDLAALLSKTGVNNVFGLSSGAIIALQAALTVSIIDKVAVYEPPLFTDQSDPTEWGPRYEREVAQDKLADALVTIGNGTGVFPWVLQVLPRFLLVPIMRYLIENENHNEWSDDIPLKDLIPTVQYDVQMSKRAHLEPESLKDLRGEVLLLGGSKSPAYLRAALDELSTVLPHATRIEFSALGHLGPNNDGRPERVAQELCSFFV
jgi:pimeloyl-ACP methyl ester carboxylesterase